MLLFFGSLWLFRTLSENPDALDMDRMDIGQHSDLTPKEKETVQKFVK